MIIPKLYMLIGLPASGKSTYAKELASKNNNTVIHSSDAIRKELFNDINDQSNNKLVFDTLHDRVNKSLSDGLDVIYDATNLSAKRRRHFNKYIIKHDCEKVAIVMATPYAECIDRNDKRDRKVPLHVMERMYKSFQMPSYIGEEFDDIVIEYSDNINWGDYNIDDLFEWLGEVEQNNPNHSMTVGEHCLQASLRASMNSHTGKTVELATLLHDIGKPFCKQFKRYDGKPTKIAHYYNHNNISAYMAMFYLNNLDDNLNIVRVIQICNVIQYHMRPYFMKSEKSKKKFVRQNGYQMYKWIMKLNEADKKAK